MTDSKTRKIIEENVFLRQELIALKKDMSYFPDEPIARQVENTVEGVLEKAKTMTQPGVPAQVRRAYEILCDEAKLHQRIYEMTGIDNELHTFVTLYAVSDMLADEYDELGEG